MKLVRFVPSGTKIDFMRWRGTAVWGSSILNVLAILAVILIGLNFGIDFKGGILLEVRTQGPADLARLRSSLEGLGLGEVSLQEFGRETDVLVRIQRQEGDEAAQLRAVEVVKQKLGASVDYRRVEFVGPKVGSELISGSIWAVTLSLLGIAVYVWFRFEWQFAVGAIVSLFHDVISTVGLFALSGLEFNLTSVAAVLTIAGYSMNDTVIIYDRIRENLRKYKSMDLSTLINVSLNETLSRTTLTHFTTFLAVFALTSMGGDVIRGFSLAMMWGVFVGTYSSIYIAAPFLIYTGLKRLGAAPADAAEDSKAPPKGSR